MKGYINFRYEQEGRGENSSVCLSSLTQGFWHHLKDRTLNYILHSDFLYNLFFFPLTNGRNAYQAWKGFSVLSGLESCPGNSNLLHVPFS